MVGTVFTAAVAAVMGAFSGVSAQGCTVTSYGQLKGAMGCSNIVISNLNVPVGQSIDLNLKNGATVRPLAFK
jgi:hypothetical protein